jgi:formylglycine-generating enzyme required for sulfatase activity
MKTNRTITRWLTVLAFSMISLSTSTVFAQGTAFTYQGRLNSSGNPASGSYDFRFKLYADPLGNMQVGASYLTNAIPVTSGLFITTIDFGAGIFTGTNYWLEVDVKTNNAGSYTVLSPLQAVTPTPYAIMANSASNLLGTLPAAQLTGSIPVSQLSGTPAAAVNFTGTLSGDVTGTQAATVVAKVGGQTAAFVASGASYANAATSVNLPSTIVMRDASGNFSAGTITANLSGNATTATTAASLAIPPGMALIPAGSFTMGDTLDGHTDAVPVSVTVSAFYMDVNLESYSQWQSVFFWATNQGYGFRNLDAAKAANHPVVQVNWYDCVKWCNARSQQAGKTPVYYTDAGLTKVYTNGETDAVYANWTAKGYRLPTEAEWEKAARGGLSGLRFPWGNIINENLANYYGLTASYTFDLGPNGYNAAFTNGVQPYTSPAGYFAPNGYGLYDMAGNVIEWCWDWYGTPYAGGTDPRGPTSGTNRVLRGTSWETSAGYAETARRSNLLPAGINANVGFRVVLAP